MSLQRIKQKLALDQVNIITATVIADSDKTVKVRTARGEIRHAVKSAGAYYTAGDQLVIHLIGNIAQVAGTAPLKPTGGNTIKHV
jgi:hypothetical protein